MCIDRRNEVEQSEVGRVEQQDTGHDQDNHSAGWSTALFTRTLYIHIIYAINVHGLFHIGHQISVVKPLEC